MKSIITSSPDILGGKPVIAGTRIPVSRIIFLLKEGYTLDAIAEEYPHISLETVELVVNDVIGSFDRPHVS